MLGEKNKIKIFLAAIFIVNIFFVQKVYATDIYIMDSWFSNFLRRYDDASICTTCQLSQHTINWDIGSIVATNGVAVNPTNNRTYAALRDVYGGNNFLVEVNMNTYAATTIGGLGDKFATLSFGSDGTLYGITGDGASNPSSLYEIDKTNASKILLATYSSNSDGEAMAFNSEDGLMYRATGDDVYAIDLSNPAVLIDVSINNPNFSANPVGLIHKGGNEFYYGDNNGNIHLFNSSTESLAFISSMSYGLKNIFYWPLDINSDPTNITLSSSTIDENQIIGTEIGTLSTIDPDVGDSHTYSFTCATPGADDSSFQISVDSLQSNEIFDYETKDTYNICIRTDDGNGGFYDKGFAIGINSVNEIPTNITLSSSTIDENQIIGTEIGTLSTIDPDVGDSHTYSFTCATPGADDSSFQISVDSLQSNEIFDYETKDIYNICVRSSDLGGEFFDKILTVSVNNMNDTPADILITTDVIDENSPIGTEIGTLSTIDPDVGDSHTYSFTCATPGANDSSFKVSGDALQSNEIFNYEIKNYYSICIRADDGSGGIYDKNFTVTVNDIDEIIQVSKELEIDLYDIKNITQTSLDLRVEVENYDDKDLTFKVKVTNKDAGESYTVKIDEKVSDNGRATLTIEDLEPGVEYSFKVKVKENDDYTDWSDSKKATTKAGDPITSFSYINETPATTPAEEAEGLFEEKNGEEKAPSPASPGTTPQASLKNTNPEKTPIIPENTMKTIIEENPVMASTVIVTGLVAGATAAAAASTASIPFYPLVPGFLRRRFAEMLSILPMIASSKKRFGIPIGKKKKETHWGVVFDSYTKHPISEVLIQLVDIEKRRVVDQTVTDENGRYGFLIAEDKEYELRINKGGYKLDVVNEKDSLYGPLYTQKQIFKKETPIQLNIAITAKGFNWERFASKIINQYNSLTSKFIKYVLDIVYIIGFGVSIYASVIYPSFINYTILTSYFVFMIYRVITKNNKKFGTIVSKQSKKPLPFTVIELFDKDTNQRVNFTVADILGRYYLLAANGNYKLKIKSMGALDGSSFEGEDEINIKGGILREDLMV